MSMIIWNAKAGKVMSLLYDGGKDKKILNLKHPVEMGDNKIIDDIDNAIRVIGRHIISISDYNGDNCDKGINNGDIRRNAGNDTNIMERTVDTLQHEILVEVLIRFIQEPDKKYQGWVGTMSELYEQLRMRLGDSGMCYSRKQFPRTYIGLAKRIEVIVLNLKAAGVIVEKYRERRGPKKNNNKIERLIQITYVGSEDSNSKEDSGIRKDSGTKIVVDGGTKIVVDGGNKEDSNDLRNTMLVPKNEVIKTKNRKERKAYNNYEVAFQHVIPELLDGIKKSKKGVVVKISDVVKELGEGFGKKSEVSIYNAVRHILFNHGIKVEGFTFEEIDPATNKGRKGLKMSMSQDGDKLPCSIRRSRQYIK